MLMLFSILLIVVGLIFGFRKDSKAVRFGRSLECVAFVLAILQFLYGDFYGDLGSSTRVSNIGKWLPILVCLGVLVLCFIRIWKPANEKKLITPLYLITATMLILLVGITLSGVYDKWSIENLYTLTLLLPFLVSLLIIAVLVYLCFSRKQTIVTIALSPLLAILFAIVWLIISAWLSYESYFTSQSTDLTSYIIATIVCLAGYLICLLFVWKQWVGKARKMAVICITGAVVISIMGVLGYKIYDKYLTLFSVASEVEDSSYMRDISLVEYEPFRKNILAKSLDEPSTLILQDNLPRLEGATALYPLYAAFARAVYPEANYPVYSTDNFFRVNNNPIVTCSTTSGAFERLIKGEADVIFLMGVSEEQREKAEEKGLELKLTPIGREAFVFFVNKRNSITNLTVEDIKGIYSGQISNWSTVGGENNPIRPYQRAENSGSQTMLMEIMGDTPLMNAPESDYYDMMFEIYQAVAVYKNYKNSLGYSFLFYINNMIAEDKVKLLSINGVEPTVSNITNGTYPFSSDFYAITVVRKPTNQREIERLENTEKLIEWILSSQGQSLIEKTGYVPLKN